MSDKEKNPKKESTESDGQLEPSSAPDPVEKNNTLPVAKAKSATAPQSKSDNSATRGAKTGSPMPPPKASAKSSRPIVAVIAFVSLVLAIGAIAGGGYLYREFLAIKSVSNKLATDQQDMRQSLDFGPQLNALSQRIDASTERTNRSDLATGERLDELQNSVSVLQETGSRSDRDWVIAETRYLLRMAQHRLALAADLDSAVAAMRAADAQLHALADVSFLPVRQALAAEIASLRSTPKPDIEGNVLALIQLARRSNKLPLRNTRAVSINALSGSEISATGSDDSPTNNGLSGKILKLVQRYVVYEPVALLDADTINMELSSSQALGKRAKLQLSLQKAQIAVLRRDQVDFIAAIASAKSLLLEHFDNNDELVARFAQDLILIERSPVRPAVSGVGTALQLLNQIIVESGA